MNTKKRFLWTLAVAASATLTACEGALLTDPMPGLETGEAVLSLAAMTGTEVTIGFESLAGETFPDLEIALYNEAEFTLTNPLGFLIVNQSDPFFFRGSTTLIPSVDGRTDLSKGGEGAFNVASIDITEVPFFDVFPAYITFTGVKADESDPVMKTVMKTFMTDGDGPQTLLFPGSFTNLSSLSWVQTGGSPPFGPVYQFDNISITFSSDPQTRDDCKKGGWDENFDGRFRNQGECVRFVERNENAKGKR